MSLNKKFGTHVKESMAFHVLKKINSIAFLEVKLLAENPCQGWKIEYFPKVEDHLIQKRGNISIRCLVYSQRLDCWLVAERFLVCQPKNVGVLSRKEAPEYHKISTWIIRQISCYWSNSQSELGTWIGSNHVALQLEPRHARRR